MKILNIFKNQKKAADDFDPFADEDEEDEE
jgi:hypothetical protein